MRTPPAADQPPRLAGYAATAEAAWMGAPQATEFLEPLRLPRLRLPRLLNREFGVAGATALLMASFFFSALLGAVRQILFNRQFGAGADASAYYAAFRLPDTLFSLVAGGALSSAFIPVLLRTRREDGEASEWRLTSLVLNSLLAGVLVITLVGELAAPLFVNHLLVPGYDAQTQALTVRLTRIMLVQPLVLVVGSVATAVLNSRNQFLLTALSVASHNLALIGGILATAAYPRLGIYGPTLGVVAGAVLQALILLPGVAGSGTRYRRVWDTRDRDLREVIRLLVPNGLAVGVIYLGFIIDTAFASRADDPATLAAVHNAWLLVGLPIALLGQAVGQAAFPRLAAHAADGAYAALRRDLIRALLAMLLLSLIGVGGLFLTGQIAVRILFQHGSFSAHDGELTTRLLHVYALGLPAYVASEVLIRSLLALRDPRTQLLTNSGQIGLRAVLLTLLLGAFQGTAIPAALAVSASAEAVLLAAIVFRRLQRLTRTTPAAPAPP
ncbi:MAG TPA: murein biosynthesis integral membrane protein MurJ [Dehalococcoidia bacterium]|nr:murein biosynthesis integral membrane protein MurJ [Dehalococcoidia bacterium]